MWSSRLRAGPFDKAHGPEQVEGLPGKVYRLYGSPSCLPRPLSINSAGPGPEGRDPAYPALAGRGTFRSGIAELVLGNVNP
jgi:hypothetical protein